MQDDAVYLLPTVYVELSARVERPFLPKPDAHIQLLSVPPSLRSAKRLLLPLPWHRLDCVLENSLPKPKCATEAIEGFCRSRYNQKKDCRVVYCIGGSSFGNAQFLDSLQLRRSRFSVPATAWGFIWCKSRYGIRRGTCQQNSLIPESP